MTGNFPSLLSPFYFLLVSPLYVLGPVKLSLLLSTVSHWVKVKSHSRRWLLVNWNGWVTEQRGRRRQNISNRKELSMKFYCIFPHNFTINCRRSEENQRDVLVKTKKSIAEVVSEAWFLRFAFLPSDFEILSWGGLESHTRMISARKAFIFLPQRRPPRAYKNQFMLRKQFFARSECMWRRQRRRNQNQFPFIRASENYEEKILLFPPHTESPWRKIGGLITSHANWWR